MGGKANEIPTDPAVFHDLHTAANAPLQLAEPGWTWAATGTLFESVTLPPKPIRMGARYPGLRSTPCYLSTMVAHAIAHAEPRRLTRSEYDRLAELGFFAGERVELVHGIVVRMSPIGPAHADPIDRLMEWLVPALLGRARVRIQQPLVAFDESEPEPDVAVVPLGPYAKAHPDHALLLVEVAESSLAYDRETKAPLYAASDVPEYWLVDVTARAVDVFTAPFEGRYTSVARFTMAGTLRPLAFPDLAIRVSELFD